MFAVHGSFHTTFGVDWLQITPYLALVGSRGPQATGLKREAGDAFGPLRHCPAAVIGNEPATSTEANLGKLAK